MSVIDFLKLLAQVKEECGVNQLFLSIHDEPFVEFSLIARKHIDGRMITYEKIYSIYELTQRKESPEVEMKWFVEAAKNAFENV